jgi:hypothetical protein
LFAVRVLDPSIAETEQNEMEAELDLIAFSFKKAIHVQGHGH